MKSLFIPFPLPLTGRQWFYLGILQGLGAGVIDGGANFGIAYAMYHSQKTIKIWVLAENTLAGDLGVTPIIQCLASMLITSTLVHTDLHSKGVAPLSFVWPHVDDLPDPRAVLGRLGQRSNSKADKGSGGNDGQMAEKDANTSPNRAEAAAAAEGAEVTYTPPPPPDAEFVDEQRHALGWRYFPLMLIRFIFEGTESNILLSTPAGSPFSLSTFFARVLLTAAQGAALGILCGLPIFLLFILVLGPLYGHENIAEKGWRWAPMVIKGVYGAVIGWITNPVIASMALGSQAEHHLVILPVDDVEDGQRQEQQRGVATIAEESEGEGAGEDASPLPLPPTTGALRASAMTPPPSSPSSLRPPIPGSPSISTNQNQTASRIRSRSRASSSLSSRSRPPLTANASILPLAPPLSPYTSQTPSTVPLPSPGYMNYLSIPTPPRTATVLPPPSPLMLTAQSARPRGATISSATSTSSGAWSYALGGTGGRAQRRPRAASTLSATARQPPPSPLNIPQATSSPRAQACDGSPQPRVLSTPGATASSPVARKDSGPSQTPNRQRPSDSGMSSTSAAWDVFGRVEETRSPPPSARQGATQDDTTK